MHQAEVQAQGPRRQRLPRQGRHHASGRQGCYPGAKPHVQGGRRRPLLLPGKHRTGQRSQQSLPVVGAMVLQLS